MYCKNPKKGRTVGRFVTGVIREYDMHALFGCLVVVEPGRVRVGRLSVICIGDLP
jgi:hypothetical protein